MEVETMKSDVDMSWKKVRINDICRPRQWKTLSMDNLENQGYPVYGANGIIGYYSEYTHEEPTLAITCRGATCGAVHITKPKSYINGNAMALDNISSEFDIKFLYYYFRYRGFGDVISGSAQPQITGEGLSKVEIPLPPLATQKRIAEILDAADALRRKDQELLEKYDELAQAIFVDMFGDPVKNEKGWEVKTVEDIAIKVTDGDHLTPKRSESGYKLLSCRNVKNGYIDFEAGLDFVDDKEFNRMYKRCNPEMGDILISCSGTIGRVTQVKIAEKFVLVRSAALIKPDYNVISPTYLEYYLQTDFMQREMLKSSNISSQANLFTGPIKALPVIMPVKTLQDKFAEEIQILENAKNTALSNIKLDNNLFNSLIQKAFKGELVS